MPKCIRYHISQFPHEEIVRLYEAQLSVNEIHKKLNLCRATVKRVLIDKGVQLRSMGDSIRLMVSKRTPEQHKAWTKAAHDAVRGVPVSHASKVLHALASEKKGEDCHHASPSERLILTKLRERGFNVIPQKAIDFYNMDLFLPDFNVAIEVMGHFQRNYDPVWAQKFKVRLQTLSDNGIMVIFVWTPAYPVTETLLDKIQILLEGLKDIPSYEREHISFRGNGEEYYPNSERLDYTPKIK